MLKVNNKKSIFRSKLCIKEIENVNKISLISPQNYMFKVKIINHPNKQVHSQSQ